MISLKILLTAGELNNADVSLLLNAGAGQNAKPSPTNLDSGSSFFLSFFLLPQSARLVDIYIYICICSSVCHSTVSEATSSQLGRTCIHRMPLFRSVCSPFCYIHSSTYACTITYTALWVQVRVPKSVYVCLCMGVCMHVWMDGCTCVGALSAWIRMCASPRYSLYRAARRPERESFFFLFLSPSELPSRFCMPHSGCVYEESAVTVCGLPVHR